jgi:hypothetical protein
MPPGKQLQEQSLWRAGYLSLRYGAAPAAVPPAAHPRDGREAPPCPLGRSMGAALTNAPSLS